MKLLHAALYFLALTSSFASAITVEAFGTAKVVNNNVDAARQLAINNAISNAIMEQGGTVRIEQHSQNGVLGDQQLSYEGQLQQFELLSEQRQGNKISVTIRADVNPTAAVKCGAASGRAKVVIPRPDVRYRQQLVIGGIYQIDSAIGKVLSNTINGEAAHAFADDQHQLHLDLNQTDSLWISELSRKQHAQYVLTIVIEDVAAQLPEKLFGYIERDGERTIALAAQLYDGFNRELIWQQRYRSKGNWPYKRQELADTATERFWETGFGEEIRRLLSQISHDVDSQLSCQPLRGRVLSIDQQQVFLDIGNNHGLNNGSQLVFVPHQQTWRNATRIQLQVDQVSPERARAKIIEMGDSMGLQTGDWVQLIRR